jgi:hypothetical protein
MEKRLMQQREDSMHSQLQHRLRQVELRHAQLKHVHDSRIVLQHYGCGPVGSIIALHIMDNQDILTASASGILGWWRCPEGPTSTALQLVEMSILDSSLITANNQSHEQNHHSDYKGAEELHFSQAIFEGSVSGLELRLWAITTTGLGMALLVKGSTFPKPSPMEAGGVEKGSGESNDTTTPVADVPHLQLRPVSSRHLHKQACSAVLWSHQKQLLITSARGEGVCGWSSTLQLCWYVDIEDYFVRAALLLAKTPQQRLSLSGAVKQHRGVHSLSGSPPLQVQTAFRAAELIALQKEHCVTSLAVDEPYACCLVMGLEGGALFQCTLPENPSRTKPTTSHGKAAAAGKSSGNTANQSHPPSHSPGAADQVPRLEVKLIHRLFAAVSPPPHVIRSIWKFVQPPEVPHQPFVVSSKIPVLPSLDREFPRLPKQVTEVSLAEGGIPCDIIQVKIALYWASNALIVCLSSDGALRVYLWETMQCLRCIKDWEGLARPVRDWEGNSSSWQDLTTQAYQTMPFQFVLFPHDRWILSMDRSGSAVVWDVDNGIVLSTFAIGLEGTPTTLDMQGSTSLWVGRADELAGWSWQHFQELMQNHSRRMNSDNGSIFDTLKASKPPYSSRHQQAGVSLPLRS